MGVFRIIDIHDCTESGCVMLICIKHIGLNLDQFTVALFAIHAPIGNPDINHKGDITFLSL